MKILSEFLPKGYSLQTSAKSKSKSPKQFKAKLASQSNFNSENRRRKNISSMNLDESDLNYKKCL